MNLSTLDLNLLLVLHTVLKEGGVRRAAEQLHVTPPAVSNALARLRTILGDPLLVRHGRGLTPTSRAMELAPRLASALESLTVALEERFDPASTRRTFSLAVQEAEQACGVPEIAAEMTRAMPHAQLQIVTLDTLAAGDGLATGAVDTAILPAPAYARASQIHAESLYEEEGVLLVRDTYRGAKGGRISREQLDDLRRVDVWLVLGKPSLGHHVAEEFFARHGWRRDVSLVVPNFFTAAMVAASSDLAAALPRRLAERFRTMLPLQVLTFPDPPLRFEQHLIWHDRTHRDPGAVLFRELVSGVMRRPFRPALAGLRSGDRRRRAAVGRRH